MMRGVRDSSMRMESGFIDDNGVVKLAACTGCVDSRRLSRARVSIFCRVLASWSLIWSRRKSKPNSLLVP